MTFSLALWHSFWYLSHCYCHCLHVRVTNRRLLAHLSLHTFELSVPAFEKWGVICKGHVNPLSHEGPWQMLLSQMGIFWGGNMRRHCILGRFMLALCLPTETARGSVWTCSILDLLSDGFLISYILGLLYSFLPRCNWICKVRYLPLEPIYLRVLWSFYHSFSHRVFCLCPPSGRFPWLRWVISKAPSSG